MGERVSNVELDARVLDAGRRFGIALQLGIVGRRDHVRAPVPQKIEQRPGDRRAFLRVCAGAKLVEQDQRAAIGVAQHPHDARNVTRKRRQTLLQALFVADVRLHTFEHGDQRSLVGGHEQAGLSHQRQ